MSRRAESCSEPGTTRTSKIRPAGRSPNVTRLPSENSKTSRFGSGLRAPLENESRYSPAKCIGCSTKDVSGNPDPKHVSTSFVQRQNWSVRTSMRRYTRLSNGFSRKLENHAAATALNYFAYNFIKIHRTLRMSPAMAAGITDRLWDVTDLVALWESYERRAERAA